MDHCGILYHAHDRVNGTFTAAQVPLEEVKVNVWIVDGMSRAFGSHGELTFISSDCQGHHSSTLLQCDIDSNRSGKILLSCSSIRRRMLLPNVKLRWPHHQRRVQGERHGTRTVRGGCSQ